MFAQEDPDDDDFEEDAFDEDADFEEGDFDEFLEEVDEPEGDAGDILEEAALSSTGKRIGPAKPIRGSMAIEEGLADVMKDELDLEEAEELGNVEELEGDEGIGLAEEGKRL
jgi:hypothetical protein